MFASCNSPPAETALQDSIPRLEVSRVGPAQMPLLVVTSTLTGPLRCRARLFLLPCSICADKRTFRTASAECIFIWFVVARRKPHSCGRQRSQNSEALTMMLPLVIYRKGRKTFPDIWESSGDKGIGKWKGTRYTLVTPSCFLTITELMLKLWNHQAKKKNGLFGVKMSYGWQTRSLALEGTRGFADMSCRLLLAADFVGSWTFSSTNICWTHLMC